MSGADPEFPIGEHGSNLEGCGPLTWALFGENACENERIGSCRGVHWKILYVDPSMGVCNVKYTKSMNYCLNETFREEIGIFSIAWIK